MAVENFADADCTLGRSTFGVWSPLRFFRTEWFEAICADSLPLAATSRRFAGGSVSYPLSLCTTIVGIIPREKPRRTPHPGVINFVFTGSRQSRETIAETFKMLVGGPARDLRGGASNYREATMPHSSSPIRNAPLRFVRSKPLACLSGTNLRSRRINRQPLVEDHVSEATIRQFGALRESSR